MIRALVVFDVLLVLAITTAFSKQATDHSNGLIFRVARCHARADYIAEDIKVWSGLYNINLRGSKDPSRALITQVIQAHLLTLNKLVKEDCSDS